MKLTGKHLLVLITMCGLIASGVGLVTNVAGLFFTPIAEEFGILKGQASLMLTICNISFAFGGMLSPRIVSERTLKPTLIAATAVLALSTIALSLCPSILPMYVLCVARGLAAGVVGFVFVTTVLNKWFVTNIGLATSIAMGCSGLAGAVFSPIVNGIIDSMGWRTGFVALGLLTLALNAPAIFLLPSLDPETAGLEALGADKASHVGEDAGQQASSAVVAISALMFIAVLGYSLFSSALTALPQHFPGLAEDYALGAALGASMISLCMVTNTAGKIVLGALIDRIGTRLSVYIYGALIGAALVLLLIMRTPQALLVAAALFGLCYSLATVGITMLTRDAFGLANYPKTYPTISLVGNIANAAFSSIVGFMYDFSGGYISTLVMFLAMLIAALGIVFFVYQHPAQAAEEA